MCVCVCVCVCVCERERERERNSAVQGDCLHNSISAKGCHRADEWDWHVLCDKLADRKWQWLGIKQGVETDIVDSFDLCVTFTVYRLKGTSGSVGASAPFPRPGKYPQITFSVRGVEVELRNAVVQLATLQWELELSLAVKSSPVTGLEWPRGFQEVKVPRFHDNGTGWW